MTVAHQGVEVVDLPSGRWSGESVALEEVAKPLDDLIGIFTGTTRHSSVPQAAPEPTQISRFARVNDGPVILVNEKEFFELDRNLYDEINEITGG